MRVQDDTIVAIATPIGEGGISVIRLSGPEAVKVADKGFRGKCPLVSVATHTAHFGRFTNSQGHVIDEVVATVFKQPQSYTGEDVVEVSCHGGIYLTSAVLNELINYGARTAEPGEFTKRAFLNGRLDLTRAEAVMELIRARSEAGARAALARLRGGLQERIEGLRRRCLNALAHIEAGIDFGDEGIEFLPRAEAIETLGGVRAELDRLIGQSLQGRLLQDGAQVAIVGRPNVGKSSLLNRLLDSDRAIVSPLPGTTRDTLEEYTVIDGIPLRLIDTAGLRPSDDPIERAGIERTRAVLERAEVVLVVLEAGTAVSPDETDWLRGPAPRLAVVNKVDQTPPDQTVAGLPEGTGWVAVSALRGDGMTDLRRNLRRAVLGAGDDLEGVLVARIRHRNALCEAREHLHQALESLQIGLSEEVVAMDLRASIGPLGEVLGLTVTDELLDTIFREFCIGK